MNIVGPNIPEVPAAAWQPSREAPPLRAETRIEFASIDELVAELGRRVTFRGMVLWTPDYRGDPTKPGDIRVMATKVDPTIMLRVALDAFGAGEGEEWKHA